HMCQYAYRAAGELVMVCDRHPAGVPMDSYGKILRNNPKARNWNWRQMMRNAALYVRGRVWHPDHKTVVLRGWHRVLMNPENLAQGRSNVTSVDWIELRPNAVVTTSFRLQLETSQRL